jgi:hypothetical protein
MTIVQSIRVNVNIIEKQQWLKDHNINSDAFMRVAFEDKFKKEYGKVFKSKLEVPF